VNEVAVQEAGITINALGKSVSGKALLFDLDGTLADTAPDLLQALNRVLSVLNFSPVLLEDARNWIGSGMRSLLETALVSSIGSVPDPALVDKGMTLFDLFYAEGVWVKSTCYPGVVEGLSEFKKIGLKMGCVTNKPRFFTEALLKKSRLDVFFDVVVAGNDLCEKKPAPLPLLHAAERLQVSPQVCVVIGDSQNDIDAALGAGMMMLLVTWGYFQSGKVSQMGATQLIKEFSQIRNVVTRSIR
jgi:phosphoglycolate phosphatase